MSGATVHHLTVKDWNDALLARAAVRNFAGLFRGRRKDADHAAASAYDVLMRMRQISKTVNMNIEVELEHRPQFVQMFVHGFDVHIPSQELQSRIIHESGYAGSLRACGCELSVIEKPGFGTGIALTIPAAQRNSQITKNQVVERMTSEREEADIIAREVGLMNEGAVQAETAPVHTPARTNGSAGRNEGGLVFIHDELRATRRQLKATVDRYDALVDLKNSMRNQLEELRVMLSGLTDTKQGLPTAANSDDIDAAVKKLAGISAHLESHFQTSLESPAFDIEVDRFSVDEVFGVLQTVFSETAERKRLDLQFDLDPAVPELNTDKSRTIRILHHLIDNALKFTEKGLVRVAAAKASHKGEVVFTVEDSGIGISQDHHRNIFGDGLERNKPGQAQFSGLPVARELVRSLGGKIAVDSRVGAGSKFTIVLPVDFDAQIEPASAESTPTDLPEALPMAGPEADKQTAVLIVEDDEATQFLMKKILSADYTCYGAASANEAFAILGKHAIRFIYMDIALRGSVDGIELTRQLRTSVEWKDIPIIALTSFTQDMTRGEALCAGCDDYLTKPIKKSEVLSKVKEYIRPYRPEEVAFLK